MSTSCVNFTELRFTSDDAMQRYLADIETIWTPAVMEELAGWGCSASRSRESGNTRINTSSAFCGNTHRQRPIRSARRSLPSASCQVPIAMKWWRGRPVACRSWTSAVTIHQGGQSRAIWPRARTRAAISPTAPTPVTTRPTELAARRRRHMSISMTPSSFAARDWHRMIMLCCCFCDSTKSRCSISPETTPHWHIPHNPSEHLTSTA